MQETLTLTKQLLEIELIFDYERSIKCKVK